ncbi:S-layer homology domain-containing protein [Aliterella atlantica]|uniref:S-layer homology domain-containing protein n=1 Tax=Aliterella atlantica TaxID=1827278 RepID=UPI0009E26723|nr:S-layer homology domain-containing protein [Aliterella atlantica]
MNGLKNSLLIITSVLLTSSIAAKVGAELAIKNNVQAQAQPALPSLPPTPAPLPNNTVPPPTPPSPAPLPPNIPPQVQAAPSSPADAISQVVAAGLMSNLADGQFHPELFVSRAELASILVRSFGLDKRAAATQAGTIEVEDVPSSHWAYKDIQTVLRTGIMKGYRGNTFFPNQKVTRAEALAIFAQAYGVFQFPDNTVEEILSQYPDAASIPAWARKSLATALNVGFVNTDTQNNINPLQPMTRADMAYALSQYLASSNRTANTQSPAK